MTVKTRFFAYFRDLFGARERDLEPVSYTHLTLPTILRV